MWGEEGCGLGVKRWIDVMQGGLDGRCVSEFFSAGFRSLETSGGYFLVHMQEDLDGAA